MTVCPKCRQEYEAHVTRCPDCEVALVAGGAEEVAAGPDGGGDDQVSRIPAADERAAVWMHERLREAGVPCAVAAADEDAPAAVVVPMPLARTAVRFLDQSPGLVRDLAGESLVYRLHDPERDEALEIHDPELLRRPAGELLARPELVVDELMTIVRRGDAAARDGAVRLARRMGDVGRRALTRQLAPLARDGREEALYLVVKEVHERLGDGGPEAPDALDALVAAARDTALDPLRRALALHALGQLGARRIAPDLITLLDDDDRSVREEADETLCVLADDDLGFDPDLPRDERRRFMELWRARFGGAGAR